MDQEWVMITSYIARCPGCGEVVIAGSYKDPEWRKELRAVIQRGLKIEGVTDEFVRENFSHCTCPKQTVLFDSESVE